ncbi:MAG: hypothetical protein ACPGSM_20775 [Thiolinea sp.]
MFVFDDALEKALENWVGTDNIYIALVTSAVVPTEADVDPELADYTQIAIQGNYTGPVLLNTWANMVTEAAGVITIDDTDAFIEWAQHASSPANARAFVIYNDTQANDPCFAAHDFGSDQDMSASALRITWHTNGIARLTKS